MTIPDERTSMPPEIELTDDDRKLIDIRRAFSRMPFGGIAHFQWSDEYLGRMGAPTLDEVHDNLDRLVNVLTSVGERYRELESRVMHSNQGVASVRLLLQEAADTLEQRAAEDVRSEADIEPE